MSLIHLITWSPNIDGCNPWRPQITLGMVLKVLCTAGWKPTKPKDHYILGPLLNCNAWFAKIGRQGPRFPDHYTVNPYYLPMGKKKKRKVLLFSSLIQEHWTISEKKNLNIRQFKSFSEIQQQIHFLTLRFINENYKQVFSIFCFLGVAKEFMLKICRLLILIYN